jgi:hypothetical protein
MSAARSFMTFLIMSDRTVTFDKHECIDTAVDDQNQPISVRDSKKRKSPSHSTSRLFRGTEAGAGCGGDITQYRPNVRTRSRN